MEIVTFSATQRSSQSEIMDSFQFSGVEVDAVCKDLKVVNKWLGGNKITINGIEELIKNKPSGLEITILDIGCGDGELLRHCADYEKKTGRNLKYIGIDFNEHIIENARQKSVAYKNISFQQVDVFSNQLNILKYDIALCTLFLHHFKTPDIQRILATISNNAAFGVVINDLQRSKIAFNLFKIFSNIFLKTQTARHDGLVSVARGFTKKELVSITEKLKCSHATVRYKWAFRYQIILKKIS